MPLRARAVRGGGAGRDRNKSFYVLRSHPDGISVNARALDPGTVTERVVRAFDGANWERQGATLAPLGE